MDIYEVMRTTFSAREFTDEYVPNNVLYKILDQARFAPSGGNRQGAHVIVIRDNDMKRKIADIAPFAAKKYRAQQKAGESPWNTIQKSQLSDSDIEAVPIPKMLTEPIAQAPVVLVVGVDLRVVASMDQELRRVGVVSGASIYPFVWNILLAARNEGYGGTITTMAISEEPSLCEILDIPSYMAVAAIIPLGRPSKILTKLRRQEVEEFTHLEKWDGMPLMENN